MYWCIHDDMFKAPRLLLPGIQLQIKLTKSKTVVYVLSSKNDTAAVFKFVDFTLHVRHLKPSPTI
jgi:hypothetical protein